jgi:hypothetical protein
MAAAARAAAAGPSPGRPADGTHHATVPRPPDGPGEEGRGAVLRPTPGISHAPVLRAAVPLVPSAAAGPAAPPGGWVAPGTAGHGFSELDFYPDDPMDYTPGSPPFSRRRDIRQTIGSGG